MQRTLHILAAISALLAISLLVLWIRSARTVDAWSLFQLKHYDQKPWPEFYVEHVWSATSSRGGLKFQRTIAYCKGGTPEMMRVQPRFFHASGTATYYPFFRVLSRGPGTDHRSFMQQLGFEATNQATGTPPFVNEGFVVPQWFVLIGLTIVPVCWLRFGLPRIRKEKRAAKGLCIACGYDLRASGDRCPECGVSVDRTPTVQPPSHAC